MSRLTPRPIWRLPFFAPRLPSSFLQNYDVAGGFGSLGHHYTTGQFEPGQSQRITLNKPMKSYSLFPTFVKALVMSCALTCAAFGQAEILTFDELSSVNDSPVPNGYGGLQWTGFDYMNPTDTLGLTGYWNALISSPNVAFNAYGGSAVLTSNVRFDLNSVYMDSAVSSSLRQVEVKGFLGGSLLYDNTYNIIYSHTTFLVFNYTGVDKVMFIPSVASQFAIDNLSVTIVPEPDCVLLVGLCIVVLKFQVRRPKNRWISTAEL